ncbi:MAG: HPr kinase/phosphorylase [Pseudolabrys sp.]
MNFYHSAGLCIASEIELPGLAPSEPRAAADIRIARGATPATLDNPLAQGPTWQLSGGEFLLTVPGVARFHLIGDHTITVTPARGGDPDDIPVFLLGSALGILLHRRQQIVLHASAVRVGDRAVLFCGASGAGKSTLAAALSQRGYNLVTDDVCTVSLDGSGAPMAHPDGRQLKLWAQAIEKLDLGAGRGLRVRRSLEKFYVAPPSEALTGSLPLGAVYVLREARPPHAAGIQKPNIVDAALLLRRNAYRPQIVRRLAQRPHYFRAAAAITNAAGIYHLTRKLDFGKLPDTVAVLETHWRDLGLTERAA